ncbi:MAG TPA: hypothetical protein VE870_11220, partial [Bacteroidales bacterium]|nr:hypothetical protein [Bacteroidales bacterium]
MKANNLRTTSSILQLTKRMLILCALLIVPVIVGAQTYTLTVLTAGAPGAIVSPSSPVTVTDGVPENISVTTVPSGYTFVNWTVTSGTASIASSISASTTVTVTGGDATVQANFSQITHDLTLTTDGTPGATTTPTGTVSVGEGVAQNISVTVPSGYSFVNWT